MSLREAMVISVALHAVLFLPLAVRIPSDKTKVWTKSVEVEYVRIEKSAAIPETPEMKLSSKVDTRPSAEVSDARARSSKDYVNYFGYIREKIRQAVKARYSGRDKAGEVLVTFTLNSEGALMSVEPDRSASTTDPELLDMAVSSVSSASPFPAFPKGITQPSMSFSLTIVFRRR